MDIFSVRVTIYFEHSRNGIKMIGIIGNLEKRAREYFSNAVNIVLALCLLNIVISGLALYQALENKKEIHEVESAVEKSGIVIKKKLDHRYFNLTKSIEEIHNVKINTLNGEIK